MKYPIILLIILCSFAKIDVLFSQNIQQNKKLTQLHIKSNGLQLIIDKSIDYLSQCVDYRDSLSFMVSLEKSKDFIYIDLTYTRNKENIFSMDRNPLGYFEIMSHQFFVFGSETFDLLEKTLNQKSFIINAKTPCYFFEDPTEWLYRLKDEKITLIKMINGCSNKDHKTIKFRFKKTD